RRGGFVARLAPALLVGRLPHRVRGQQRARRAPHHFLDLVVDICLNARVEVVGELCVSRQLPGDEQDARLAAGKGRVALRGQLHALHVVRTGAEELEISCGQIGEVEPRLRAPTRAQPIEPTEHARVTYVEVLHWARAVPSDP